MSDGLMKNHEHQPQDTKIRNETMHILRMCCAMRVCEVALMKRTSTDTVTRREENMRHAFERAKGKT